MFFVVVWSRAGATNMAAFPKGALTPPGSSPVYPSSSLSPASSPSSPTGPPTPDSVHMAPSNNPIPSPNPVAERLDNVTTQATSQSSDSSPCKISTNHELDTLRNSTLASDTYTPATNDSCSSGEWAELPNCEDPASGSLILGPKHEVGVSCASAVKWNRHASLPR